MNIFSSNYFAPLSFFMVLVGAFSVWVDSPTCQRQGLQREKRWAKILGWFHLIGGVSLFIFVYVMHTYSW